MKALARVGYYIRSQRGSHIVLKHPDRKSLTIPNHKNLKKGLLLSIIKRAGISRNEFIKLLKGDR